MVSWKLRVAPLEVVTTTVTLYAPAGVPAVGPTMPGLPEPPAQPDRLEDKAASRMAVAASAQTRRKRIATELRAPRKRATSTRPKSIASASSSSVNRRRRSRLPGRQVGPGTTIAEVDA